MAAGPGRAKLWLSGGGKPLDRSQPQDGRAYEKVVYRIAREIGGFFPWLWAFGHWRRLG